jgi:hypothetical protein
MKKNIIAFLIIILFPTLSFTQDEIDKKYKEWVDYNLHQICSNPSQIDTSTSLAGELRVYKKICFVKIRTAKGVGRHEYVYSNDNLIYYKDINEYYKNKKLITLIYYYYYIGNEFVKFEEIQYKREKSKDLLIIAKRNILYLDNETIVDEALDKNHPNKTSSKDLRSLLKSVNYQLDQFRLIRKYDLENKLPSR